MARHDNEQHAQRHDDDVAVLQDEVGHVDRFEQRARCRELEEYHDHQQREQQRVVADIGLDETENLHPVYDLAGYICHVTCPMIS